MDMDAIINKIVESQTKFATVKLFKENPYVMDNRFGLSLWIGRPEEVLVPELEQLIEMGVIHRWGSEPGAIYAYTRNQEMRRQIEERWPEISERAGKVARAERRKPPGSRPAPEDHGGGGK